mgnify:CR=1 FL=1
MTQTLYIDPNSELVPSEKFVKQFFEDHVPKKKYRFAAEEECENLVCIINRETMPKVASFKKISCEYLYNILNEVFHDKSVSRPEQIEIIKMCLSKDEESRVLGISLLCKFAFPRFSVTYLTLYIKRLACYILSENEGRSDFAKMYRLAFARDHFKNTQIQFFKDSFFTNRSIAATRDIADHYLKIRSMVLDHFDLMDKNNE